METQQSEMLFQKILQNSITDIKIIKINNEEKGRDIENLEMFNNIYSLFPF